MTHHLSPFSEQSQNRSVGFLLSFSAKFCCRSVKGHSKLPHMYCCYCMIPHIPLMCHKKLLTYRKAMKTHKTRQNDAMDVNSGNTTMTRASQFGECCMYFFICQTMTHMGGPLCCYVTHHVVGGNAALSVTQDNVLRGSFRK